MNTVRGAPGLPELVQDAELPATLHPNASFLRKTIHVKHLARDRVERETWVRVNRLGRGGFGVVWLERRDSSNSLRAVKEMSIKNTSGQDQYVHELEALAKFSQDRFSQFFVKMFGWFEASERLFIAMEYCPYGDLGRYLEKNGRIRNSQAMDITWQLLQGLVFMHENKFAHRDLKPANILIKRAPPRHRWVVKIADLGLSKKVAGDSQTTATMIGTPAFMAPELIPWIRQTPGPVDPYSADMWALGETVHQLLTCRRVFTTEKAVLGYIEGREPFPEGSLQEFSARSAAINFVQAVMAAKPESRLTAREARDHPWTCSTAKTFPDVPPEKVTPDSRSSKGFSLHGRNSQASGAWTLSLPAQDDARKPPPAVDSGMQLTITANYSLYDRTHSWHGIFLENWQLAEYWSAKLQLARIVRMQILQLLARSPGFYSTRETYYVSDNAFRCWGYIYNVLKMLVRLHHAWALKAYNPPPDKKELLLELPPLPSLLEVSVLNSFLKSQIISLETELPDRDLKACWARQDPATVKSMAYCLSQFLGKRPYFETTGVFEKLDRLWGGRSDVLKRLGDGRGFFASPQHAAHLRQVLTCSKFSASRS